MKTVFTTIMLLLVLSYFASVTYAQNCESTNTTTSRINGIYHTSCFPWLTTDGKIMYKGVEKNNDQPRLQRAVWSTYYGGKIIFNEPLYYVDRPIELVSFLILEGMGKQNESYGTSKIILTADNTHIFRFRGGINQVSIRDMTLEADPPTNNNTIGILAQGINYGCSGNSSNTSNQFSNLYIGKFTKGMYVNSEIPSGCTSTQPGWQFDNTRIDHVLFYQNKTGLEINAGNSGFDMSNVLFDVPANGYGVYAPYAGYGTMNRVDGAGTKDGQGNPIAETFIYMQQHSVWSIQSSAVEGFRNALVVDTYVDGTGTSAPWRTFPINLINNAFNEGVSIKGSTVVSTGNMYSPAGDNEIKLLSGTHMYSVGDKFCWEGYAPHNCQEAGFVIPSGSNAKVFFKSNERETKIDNLKLSSTSFSALSSTAENGSLIYCADCQQTSACSGGGSGALAKRVAGVWKCN